MGRLRSGFDHGPCPSKYGRVWKHNPVLIRFQCWLIDYTSLPHISMYFLDKHQLSRLQFHAGSVRSRGCLLSNSLQILEFSMEFPTHDGSWGRDDLGFLLVRLSSGDGRLAPIGVVLYSRSP